MLQGIKRHRLLVGPLVVYYSVPLLFLYLLQ